MTVILSYIQGIDSYYEYLLKAYILLGDESYLRRFNRHYEGIMKYISQGPLLVDVHMHKPRLNAKVRFIFLLFCFNDVVLMFVSFYV